MSREARIGTLTIPTCRLIRTGPGLASVGLLVAWFLTGGCTGPPPPRPAPPASPSASTQPITRTAAPVAAADPRAYYHFILGYQAELAQDMERAIREYLAALRVDPSSLHLKTRLALLYFSVGESANAVRFADRVVEADPSEAAILAQMASIYASAGQADKALALYERAIERNPGDSELYFWKGLLLINAKRFDEAEQVLQQGIERGKDSPVGHYYLGRVYAELKRFDQAVASYEQAIAVNPAFEPGYLALASVYESQQERDKAAEVYRRYLQKVNPHSRDIRRNLIRLFISGKAYQEALAELQRMLQDDPDDLDAQLRVGLVYGEMKDYPRGHRAADLAPGRAPGRAEDPGLSWVDVRGDEGVWESRRGV